MKTIKQIVDDCGLDGLRPSTLVNILAVALEESLKQTDEANRRIKELEAEKAAAVDMLRSVSLDCQMAPCGGWDKADEGFTCMREGADNVLTQMGAEPPVHVSEEAYRDEWNCPSCGGESEDDGGGARRCHPCGLRFTPAEEEEAP